MQHRRRRRYDGCLKCHPQPSHCRVCKGQYTCGRAYGTGHYCRQSASHYSPRVHDWLLEWRELQRPRSSDLLRRCTRRLAPLRTTSRGIREAISIFSRGCGASQPVTPHSARGVPASDRIWTLLHPHRPSLTPQTIRCPTLSNRSVDTPIHGSTPPSPPRAVLAPLGRTPSCQWVPDDRHPNPLLGPPRLYGKASVANGHIMVFCAVGAGKHWRTRLALPLCRYFLRFGFLDDDPLASQ